MTPLNYRNQIVLDHHNYQAWRHRTHQILRAERVQACVLWAPHRLARRWPPEELEAKERRARQVLRLLVGAKLWPQTSAAADLCARDIWLELERRHATDEPPEQQQQQQQQQQQTATMEPPAPPAPNLVRASLELVAVFERLTRLGSPLSDADKIKCIIKALPGHYQEPLGAYLAQRPTSCACSSDLKHLQQLIVTISRIVQAELCQESGAGAELNSQNVDETQTEVCAEQQQQQLPDPITPPEEQQGPVVHSEPIQSPDDAWSPASNSLVWRAESPGSPRFPCCRPDKLCDPRLHKLKQPSQFKPQLKKREFKIPHITKPPSSSSSPPSPPPSNLEDKDKDPDEELLGQVEVDADGHKFKRVGFVFSDNHRLNIVNDMSILHKLEPISPFTIFMKDSSSLVAKHRGYVRSESGNFSAFYAPTSDNNYLSIKAMNSKFYLPPKPTEQDYSDTRIRDMVKYNRLKNLAKIILKVKLPTHHHHHHQPPVSLKRRYSDHRPQKHHKSTRETPETRTPSASPEPKASGRDRHDNAFLVDSEDAADEYEPGLAYDLLTSMEQNKLLSPSFK